MKQHEFIWKVSSNTDMNMVQTTNGITECTVKGGIILSHDYKRNDLVLIKFNELHKKFIIASDKEFREIIQIINNNDNVNQPLIEYATKNLKEM